MKTPPSEPNKSRSFGKKLPPSQGVALICGMVALIPWNGWYLILWNGGKLLVEYLLLSLLPNLPLNLSLIHI